MEIRRSLGASKFVAGEHTGQDIEGKYGHGDEEHAGPGQLLPVLIRTHGELKNRHRQTGHGLAQTAGPELVAQCSKQKRRGLPRNPRHGKQHSRDHPSARGLEGDADNDFPLRRAQSVGRLAQPRGNELKHDLGSANHHRNDNERQRNEVMLRIATLEGIQPAALRELNEAMLRILSGSSSVKRTAMGGVRTVAEILNFIGTANETSVVDAIREYDPDLAQKILDEMFVFENLMDIDDRSIQLILREVQSDSLILALKGASPDLREKIFRNMSQRAAEMLREDLESKGPVRLSEVEAEQKEILKVVRRLADEGQIVLGGAGGEQMV